MPRASNFFLLKNNKVIVFQNSAFVLKANVKKQLVF
jgi:hypothetical protein